MSENFKMQKKSSKANIKIMVTKYLLIGPWNMPAKFQTKLLKNLEGV